MVKNRTAVFIGHSDCFGVSTESMKEIIRNHIEKYGVTYFLSGGQGGFDRLCAKCVFDLKKDFPNIKNYLVIPYLNFNIFDKKIFDEIIYPDGFEKFYYKYAIIKRNEYMVNNSEFAICYVTHSYGGAYKTYEKANKNNLKIFNLSDKALF